MLSGGRGPGAGRGLPRGAGCGRSFPGLGRCLLRLWRPWEGPVDGNRKLEGGGWSVVRSLEAEPLRVRTCPRLAQSRVPALGR